MLKCNRTAQLRVDGIVRPLLHTHNEEQTRTAKCLKQCDLFLHDEVRAPPLEGLVLLLLDLQHHVAG